MIVRSQPCNSQHELVPLCTHAACCSVGRQAASRASSVEPPPRGCGRISLRRRWAVAGIDAAVNARGSRSGRRQMMPVATDATSADFPRAVCRRKALKGERGPTPLHPGGPPLGGPTSSASSTRRAANVFVRRLPCRGCACVYLCECVCLGGRVCVAAPCEPSRASHACGPPQQILGSRAGPCPASVVCVLAGQLPCFCFCFCGSRVVSVRSVRVALVSRVCLRTSQSTFVLTFPKLHMYALL